MSDTAIESTTTLPDDAFDLDPNEVPRTNARKAIYVPENLNTFATRDHDGKPVTGYFTAESVRLTRMTVRMQQVRDSRTDRMKNAVVVNFSLVADNDEIGHLEGEAQAKHPLYTEPRYKVWQNMSLDRPGHPARPHRIEGQQFVQMENIELLVDLLNFFGSKDVPMQVIKNPAKAPERKTADTHLVVPANSGGARDVRELGVKLDWFEVSINEERDRVRNFGRGFSDFFSGLEDQRNRIENAIQQGEAGKRDLMIESLRQMRTNINYLTGVFNQKAVDDARGATGSGRAQHWPRKADMGVISVDGHEFNLYRPDETQVSVDEFLEMAQPSESDSDVPTREQLTSREDFTRPAAEELADNF